MWLKRLNQFRRARAKPPDIWLSLLTNAGRRANRRPAASSRPTKKRARNQRSPCWLRKCFKLFGACFIRDSGSTISKEYPAAAVNCRGVKTLSWRLDFELHDSGTIRIAADGDSNVKSHVKTSFLRGCPAESWASAFLGAELFRFWPLSGQRVRLSRKSTVPQSKVPR